VEYLLGRTRMNWRQVAAIAIFVFGAVAASLNHNDTLAATLAGAAAGFAMMSPTRPHETPDERRRRESSPPPTKPSTSEYGPMRPPRGERER